MAVWNQLGFVPSAQRQLEWFHGDGGALVWPLGSQVPAEPLIPFGPSILGQGVVGKAVVALCSVGGCIPLGTQALETVLVPTERQISAQDSLWGRVWPHSRRVFHPPAPCRLGESVPGHCALTPAQLWTLMDYK